MSLIELIEIGKNIIITGESNYDWLICVEDYFVALPNKTYANRAKGPIDNYRFFIHNKEKKQDAARQIIAILKRIYDNDQEQFLRSNTHVPLLSIFSDSRLSLVQSEFESAVQFKNENRYKQSITESCKSIESMMKAICLHSGIEYNGTDTWKDLVKILKNNHILPLNGMLDGHQVLRNKSTHGADDQTYDPTKEDAELEINRGAALLIYLYKKSGMGDDVDG